jgi:hypothetical protein
MSNNKKICRKGLKAAPDFRIHSSNNKQTRKIVKKGKEEPLFVLKITNTRHINF